MNLNNNPTVQDLSNIMASCNDNSGHHVLWVSKSGDVYITLMTNYSPVGVEEATPSMAMRYETFDQGNDYVGQNAANDTNHVTRVLKDLQDAWSNYSGQGVTYIG